MRLPLRPSQMDVSDLLPVQWYQNKYGKLPETDCSIVYPYTLKGVTGMHIIPN